MCDVIEVLSVNVGQPEVIDVWPTKDVVSAIRKRPVETPTIELSAAGLGGDRQADTRRIGGVQVHGGPGKAVYVYPSEHFAAWQESIGQEVGPGAFGENLTIRGVTEREACIGDVWRWGDALLQITEPRGPCYKLEIHRGEPRIRDLMNAVGATGWYMRVLRSAEVSTAGPLQVVERDRHGISVLDVHQAWDRRDRDSLERLLELPPLGSDLKQMIRNVLRSRGRV